MIQKKYNHQIIEKKWQKIWQEKKLYKTSNDKKKPKYYVLDMFPYPSGAGLHVGHPKGYIATDIVARQKMMQGYNVLHPMGWDAFGLPAENYALKNKIHPAKATAENIAVFKQQLSVLGFTYDWEREVNTTDPSFYQWTQWIFLQMYENYYDERLNKAQPIRRLIEKKFGTDNYYQLDEEQKKEIDAERLAYEEYAPINWCPACMTGLANEDLEDGKCERCGSVIEKKPMRQWVLRITKYADRLLQDLLDLDWEPFIKTMQTNWIGRSQGAILKFTLEKKGEKVAEMIEVFTTRADTIGGCTAVVVAPEWWEKQSQKWTNDNFNPQVIEYCRECKSKSEIERTDLNRVKTGVKVDDLWAINPVNGEKVPVYVADYVLGDYGTGAVMVVPAHDERDFEFAQKYQLPIKKVIVVDNEKENQANTQEGVLINSGKYNGLSSEEAREQIVFDLQENNLAEKKVNYKLRDWVFSRQRYWGEPIPMIHCDGCGVVPVAEKDLPLKLPAVENYEPSGTGESPLVNIKDWVEVECPICGGKARRETNTMPQWAGSSWYYLRYLDPKNKKMLVDSLKEQYMMPVDFYVGGAEHATRHLIYARFYHKFLYDLGVVSTKEPFTKLQHVGLILAEDGRKMSKRWNNVINPDEIVNEFGADAMRVYEMFMGPFGSPCAWNTQGVVGVRKFLLKVWELKEKVVEEVSQAEYMSLLHQTIQKVTMDIAEFKLNTAVSALMILTNKMQESEQIAQADYEKLLQLLAPLAPHITEELWSSLGKQESVFKTNWPEYDEELAKVEKKILPIQINGKVRDEIEIVMSEVENEAWLWTEVLGREKIKKNLENKIIVKKIYIMGKIFNLVVKE